MLVFRPILFAALMAVAGIGHAAEAKFCGELKNHVGPFDYRERAANAYTLDLVEGAHFTPDVENGVKGASSYLGGDIAYTLHVFPNHHRALATMARVSIRDKTPMIFSMRYPVECYFERAMRFAPDDGAVMAEYGNYMHALGKSQKALEAFKRAVALSPENPAINYNLGLEYFTQKDYENSATFAKKAYALGFPLPGLKTKLRSVGKWDESTN